MTDSDASLIKLAAWYEAQCDGDWEHGLGVKIDTIDNPGWRVVVDLEGTEMEGVEMRPLSFDNDEHDWMFCTVENLQFQGVGDPRKLLGLIDVFLSFAVDKSG